MAARSSPRLVFALLVGAAVAAWLLGSLDLGPNGGEGERDGSEAGADLPASEVEAPGLQVREGRVPAAETNPRRSEAVHPEDWVIEITEVVGPDGTAAVGAQVFIDRTVYGEDVFSWYTWQGEPLRVRLRRQVPAHEAPPARAEMSPYASEEPLYISIRHDRFASWFAPALLCPAGRTSTLRAQLLAPRKLHGRVRAQDGGSLSDAVEPVLLTIPGVPEGTYSAEAPVDEEGRFEFEPHEIPGGRVVLRARSELPSEDGCPVSVEVEPHEEEVILDLIGSHRFEFQVSFVEEDVTLPLPSQVVMFRPVDAESGRGVVHRCNYAVGKVRSDTRRHEPFEFVLPDGPAQRWQVTVPGYRTAEVSLDPSGPERDHRLPVAMRPGRNSALLVMNLELPSSKRVVLISVRAVVKELGSDFSASWYALALKGQEAFRGALRVPSGCALTVQIQAGVKGARMGERWLVDPFRVTLSPGETLKHDGRLVSGGTLWVYRKPVGGLMPELRVLVSRADSERELLPWTVGRDEGGAHAYLCLEELGPGRWVVSLVRDGKPLSWSHTVQIHSGKQHYVHLPDVTTLK